MKHSLVDVATLTAVGKSKLESGVFLNFYKICTQKSDFLSKHQVVFLFCNKCLAGCLAKKKPKPHFE
jgi:hypothetical protein